VANSLPEKPVATEENRGEEKAGNPTPQKTPKGRTPPPPPHQRRNGKEESQFPREELLKGEKTGTASVREA